MLDGWLHVWGCHWAQLRWFADSRGRFIPCALEVVISNCDLDVPFGPAQLAPFVERTSLAGTEPLLTAFFTFALPDMLIYLCIRVYPPRRRQPHHAGPWTS